MNNHSFTWGSSSAIMTVQALALWKPVHLFESLVPLKNLELIMSVPVLEGKFESSLFYMKVNK